MFGTIVVTKKKHDETIKDKDSQIDHLIQIHTNYKEQKEWVNKLNEQGYKAVVCNGFEEARDTIEEYLASQQGRFI